MTNPAEKCYSALIFDEEEEYDKFISQASSLLEKDPANHIVLNNRGIAYSEIGHWQEAERDLKASCEAKPSEVTSALNLAEILKHQEKLEEALSSATHAIGLGSTYAYSYAVRAEVLRKLNRNSEAQSDEDTWKQLRAP